jgi:hypothetical protein
MGGLFIDTYHPNALLKQLASLLIQAQNRPGAVQKLVGIKDMLPQPIAPGFEFLRGKPAPNGTGSNLADQPRRYHKFCVKT